MTTRVVGYISEPTSEFMLHERTRRPDNMPYDSKEFIARIKDAVTNLSVGESIFTDVDMREFREKLSLHATNNRIAVVCRSQEGGSRVWRVK